MNRSLNNEQKAILQKLSHNDSYRGELLDLVGGTYLALSDRLSSLIKGNLIGYRFDEDNCQQFFITDAGREAIGLKAQRRWFT